MERNARSTTLRLTFSIFSKLLLPARIFQTGWRLLCIFLRKWMQPIKLLGEKDAIDLHNDNPRLENKFHFLNWSALYFSLRKEVGMITSVSSELNKFTYGLEGRNSYSRITLSFHFSMSYNVKRYNYWWLKNNIDGCLFIALSKYLFRNSVFLFRGNSNHNMESLFLLNFCICGLWKRIFKIRNQIKTIKKFNLYHNFEEVENFYISVDCIPWYDVSLLQKRNSH